MNFQKSLQKAFLKFDLKLKKKKVMSK
jgi:hypothetical protein